MAVAFGAVGNLAQATTGNLTVVPPAISDNDILIIVAFGETSNAFACSGFTSFNDYDNTGSAFHTTMLWKRASGESGNYTVTHTGTVWKAAIMFTITGCPTTGDPFSGTLTNKTINATSITTTSMTPADNDNLMVFVVCHDADCTTASWAGGSLTWTERKDVITTGSIYMALSMATAPQATAAAVAPTATASQGYPKNATVFSFKAAAGGAYTLACAQGSFSLTGQALTTKADHTMPAAQGSYSLSGQDLALNHGYKLTADQGSFSLTGEAAGLTAAHLLAMEQGAFVLTGQDAGLLAARLLTMEQGAFVLAGQDVALVYTPAGAYLLTAEGGTFALSGQGVALVAARRIAAGQGAYIVAGQDVTMVYGALGAVAAFIPCFRRRKR